MCFNNLNAVEKFLLMMYYLSQGIYVIFTDSFNELSNTLTELFS